jgi:hypothetical protein
VKERERRREIETEKERERDFDLYSFTRKLKKQFKEPDIEV